MEKHMFMLGSVGGDLAPRPPGQLDQLAETFAGRADRLARLLEKFEQDLTRIFGEANATHKDNGAPIGINSPYIQTALQRMYSTDTMLENSLNELNNKLDRLSSL